MTACMEPFNYTFAAQDVDALLCMPQVLADLIEACLDGNSSQPLVDIVLRDAALAAKIILTASRISSEPLDPAEPVSSAIQRMGIPMITGVALRSARQVVQCEFTPEELSFQYGLWFSSQVAGLTARCLAPSVNYPNIEEAQLSGLLLNLGIHALFVREGDSYVDLDVNPWSSVIQCHLEEAEFKIDHLQIADKIIGQWQLDSFLADAIRFLHADIAQIEKNNVLLKIARLSQQFCQNPQQLVTETEVLAERLFSLNKSEVNHLFDWVRGGYPSFGSLLDNSAKLQGEQTEALKRLTELTFLLADQEATRARLASGKTMDDLVQIARNLYLEHSSATETVFFLLDQKNQQLTGVLTAGQSRLIGELIIPIAAESSLVSAGLFSGIAVDSFQPSQSLTVTDHLLLRLCKSRGLSCHPFLYEGQALGVVALGIESEQALQKLQSLQMRMFGQVVGAEMMRIVGTVQDPLDDSSSLLRRVSHEVASPLTIIGNYAGVLNCLLADDDNRKITESIRNEARRIDDIIDYYLSQHEIPNFPEYRINLNQLVRDIVASVEDVELKPRQIVTHFDLQRKLVEVATNPILLKQIMINLLKNATEAVSEGGLIQLITRDGYSADNGSYVEIVVRDNGTGITPQLQKKLFKPMASTKGASHSGVGLSIVKGMVDDLGGRISCHSSSESGTSFHLQIPYETDQSK